MNIDGAGLFFLLAGFVLTFVVARFFGKGLRARRAAARAADRERQAGQALAGQSRQVRRAAARRNQRAGP